MPFYWRKIFAGGNLIRRAAPFALLVAAGCSSVETRDALSVVDDAGPVPDHRRIIIASLLERGVPPVTGTDGWTYLVNDPRGMGPYEVSTEVRRVYANVGWAWLACLKAANQGELLHIAVFIQNNRVKDVRAQVLSDQCHDQSYTPLRVPFPTGRERSPARSPSR